MCNPALALQGVGAGLGAIGAYSEARSKKSALNYEADVALLNAEQAEQRAQISLEQGQFQTNQVRRAAAQEKGTARQQYAAGGVVVGYGSAAEVAANIDMLSDMDAEQAEINAIRAAWGHRADKVNRQNDARSKRASAKSIDPFMSAATSLIGSAGSMASSYGAAKKAGTVGGGKKPSRGKWGVTG